MQELLGLFLGICSKIPKLNIRGAITQTVNHTNIVL